MKTGTLVKISFASSFLFVPLGACLKIMRSGISDKFLVIGLVGSLIFVVSAIYEVRTSTRIDHRQKTLWTIGFILLGNVTGLFYIIRGRKNIAAKAGSSS